MRKLNPWLAFLANFAAIGLGYVYVGRIRYAFALIAATLGIVAIAAWAGLLFHAVGFYSVTAIAMVIALLPLVHCPLIAAREKSVAVKRYNVWWVYVLWIAVFWIAKPGLIEIRSTYFGFDNFNIPSGSMAPTLQNGDFVIVDTWSFKDEGVAHGDLLVFVLADEFGTMYVKRVVGIPGDTVAFSNGVLYRNGAVIEEPYLGPDATGPNAGKDQHSIELGSGDYFVLGDNRGHSRDSRYLGVVREDQLHGIVKLRWFAYRDGVQFSRFPFVFE